MYLSTRVFFNFNTLTKLPGSFGHRKLHRNFSGDRTDLSMDQQTLMQLLIVFNVGDAGILWDFFYPFAHLPPLTTTKTIITSTANPNTLSSWFELTWLLKWSLQDFSPICGPHPKIFEFNWWGSYIKCSFKSLQEIVKCGQG